MKSVFENKFCCIRALLRFLIVLCTLCNATPCHAQQDTLVTVLREVNIVGVKQSPSTELAAVSTLTPAQVQRLGIVTMRDVSEMVPNFYLPQYGSRMTSSVYVRGLGARIDQPVVGLNIDGVPYLNKDNYDFDLVDIAGIQVFRGAQSILNGRNTMAGQVNISTLSPWQVRGIRATAEFGNYNSYKGALAWYGRLSPSLATSISAYLTGNDGYHRNDYNGCRVGTERQGSLRWKLSWHPSTRLSVTNVLSGQLSRQHGYPYRSLASGKIATDDTCYYWRNSVADGLTVGWTGRRVTVTSQTSVQTINDNMTLDQDFLPIPMFTLTQRRREYAFTQDLYAKGRRGEFNWLGGAFAFYRHTRMAAPVTFLDQGIADLIEKHPNQMNPSYPISWDKRDFLLGSDFLNIAKGVALYQQSSWHHGPWDLQLGLRWDLELASLSYRSHCDASYTIWHVTPEAKEFYARVPVDIDESGHLRHVFSQLLPKLAVGYTMPGGSSLYANVAKGYKAGGFNSQMFSDVLQQKVMSLMGLAMQYDIDQIVSYRPEKSWNFEVGYKSEFSPSDLPAGRWGAEATLFYILCTDQQLTTFPDGLTTGRIMTNAGRTRSLGAELSVAWRPADVLTLRGSYGFTDARFSRYNNGKADLAGKRLPYAPSNTAFLSADLRLPSIGSVSPVLNINTRGVGDIYWNDENSEIQPFYMLCSASLSLSHPLWNLRLWADNITGTRYDTFYFVSMGNAFAQCGRPFTFGATLRLSLSSL